MLASTVQFSNNDQYTVTHPSGVLHRRRQLKATSRPYLQTPNSVPDTPATRDQRSTLRRAVLAARDD